MVETAVIEVKEILFEGIKVRLKSGEIAWIDRERVKDYLPRAFVVPRWYREEIMKKIEQQQGEEP